MSSKCSVCGISLDNGQPQANGMCIDCFADKWGEIVEKYPICSQPHVKPEDNECFEVEYDDNSNDFILIVGGNRHTIGAYTPVIELYDIAKCMRDGNKIDDIRC